MGSSGAFQVGQQLLVDTAANQEQFNIVAIPDPTHIVADKLAKAHAANVPVASNVPAWINNGPVTLGSTAWQPRAAYLAGQFVLDSNGNLQTVQVAAMSGVSEPAWNGNPGDVTVDGTLKWSNGGTGKWQANHAYKAGRFIIDPKGNTQTAQADGTSGSLQPLWQATVAQSVTTTATAAAIPAGSNVSVTVGSSNGFQVGQQLLIDAGANQEQFTVAAIADTTHLTADRLTKNHAAGVVLASTAVTSDGSVNWLNNGQSTWQNKTSYLAGQFILDHNGNIEMVAVGGTSADTPPRWNAAWGQKTADGGVTWINNGFGKWQANSAYVAGQFIFDRSGSLQVVQTAGTSAISEPQWSTVSGQTTTDGKVTWIVSSWGSVDLQGILRYPNAFPGIGSQFPLLNSVEQQDLTNNGLQHFIDRVNAKISKADDLINLAFLTAQTDIYRYRQNVLGATAASKLATSPILANIATGDTSNIVSQDLQSFLKSLPTIPPPPPPPSPTTPTPPPATGTPGTPGGPGTRAAGTTTFKTMMISQQARTFAPVAVKATPEAAASVRSTQISASSISRVSSPSFTATGLVVKRLNGVVAPPTVFRPILRGTAGAASTVTDVSQQQPLVGAQLNIRTLTVAERLAQSPSQEALFYSVSNRLAFLQLLTDLDLTIEDLPILVDTAPASNTNPNPVETHTLAELRNLAQAPALLARVQSVQVQADADEATVFSNGIRVLEQHSQLLRALEGRVQQYRDFVSFCTAALSNVQTDLQRAQTSLQQLGNGLLQDRQNVAFTTQLLAEETARVSAVNAKRIQTLQNSVQVLPTPVLGRWKRRAIRRHGSSCPAMSPARSRRASRSQWRSRRSYARL